MKTVSTSDLLSGYLPKDSSRGKGLANVFSFSHRCSTIESRKGHTPFAMVLNDTRIGSSLIFAVAGGLLLLGGKGG